MKKYFLLFGAMLVLWTIRGQKVEWIWFTEVSPRTKGPNLNAKPVSSSGAADLVINPYDTLQEIEGSGACFNELGWEALLSIPVGSNDYSLNYCSCNQHYHQRKKHNSQPER